MLGTIWPACKTRHAVWRTKESLTYGGGLHNPGPIRVARPLGPGYADLLESYAFLKAVLERLPKHSARRIGELLLHR